jgi:hypothetical protein
MALGEQARVTSKDAAQDSIAPKNAKPIKDESKTESKTDSKSS